MTAQTPATSGQPAPRNPLEGQILERVAKDTAFRQQLAGDPKGVIEREFGVALPAFIDLKVVEETPTTMYLVPPSAEVATGQELSDAQLEAVAGGWSAVTDCGTCHGQIAWGNAGPGSIPCA